MNILLHTIFWVLSGLFLTLFYGYRNDSIETTIWFVAALMPISMITMYFFNYRLIPVFLLKERFFTFGLYSFYTLVVSAYVEFLLLIFLLVFLADLNIDTANFDSVFLLAGMYIPVLLGIVAKLFRTWKSAMTHTSMIEQEKSEILERINPSEETVVLRADRINHQIKPADILYIEGLKDYVKVHLDSQKPLIVKETLSEMLNILSPFKFERIHKSYIVSITRIDSYNTKQITIQGTSLPIGRSYKNQLNLEG